MTEDQMNKVIESLVEDLNASLEKGTTRIAELFDAISRLPYSQRILNAKVAEFRNKDILNLADALTSDEPYGDFRYSRTYTADELSEEDIKALKAGSPNGNFICVASDNREHIENNPADCRVGCLGYGVLGDGYFSVLTTFDRNRDGMPFGSVSFSDELFKYVRFVINPYGEDDFAESQFTVEV